jgi:hypothetical protein
MLRFRGTALDLPYRFGADDSKMQMNRAFRPEMLLGAAADAAMCCMIMSCLLSLLDGDGR